MMTDFVLFRGVIFERVSFCPSFFHFFLEIGPTNFFFLKSDKVSDCISLMCWCSATHFRFKTRKNLKLLRSDNKLCPITDFSRKNTRETSDHTNSQKTDQKSGLKIRVVRPSGDELSCCGPIQWARGDVGRKPSAAARPRTLVQLLWRAAASGLKRLRLPRAQNTHAKQCCILGRVATSNLVMTLCRPADAAHIFRGCKFVAHEKVHAEGAQACKSRRGAWTIERTSRISCSKRALLTSGCIEGMLWDRAEWSKRNQPSNRVSSEFVCLSSRNSTLASLACCSLCLAGVPRSSKSLPSSSSYPAQHQAQAQAQAHTNLRARSHIT